jgi:hypothetical protein
VQRARTSGLAILAAAAFFAAGCIMHHHHPPGPPVVVHAPGPPPHAPAHGHRHKHPRDRVELVFESKLGVYVVVGHADHWYCDDHYYRAARGAWYVATRFEGPWKLVEVAHLPAGLRVHHAKVKGKGKAKGHARH